MEQLYVKTMCNNFNTTHLGIFAATMKDDGSDQKSDFLGAAKLES